METSGPSLLIEARANQNPRLVSCDPVSLLHQMEKKKQENKMRRDQLNDEYLELLDKQRLYFKTVKDFKEVRDKA